MPSQHDSVDSATETLIRDRVASRIWQKDASLWPAESPGAEPATEIMGWLGLADEYGPLSASASEIASDLRSADFTDAVMCGMGGSSMTPEALRVIFGAQSDGFSLHVMDTVNPGTIGPLTEQLNLAKTVFIIASKSGTTVEPLSLEKHFREALKSAGVSETSKNFIAISDAGTPLAKRTGDGQFFAWLETRRDIGGRFSALTAFGVLPAALLGIDLQRYGASFADMAIKCAADESSNPGLQLGAFLGAQAVAGRDKVTLLTSPDLDRLSLWVEQLLAESTGKQGKGLIPIANEPLFSAETYGPDRTFVYTRLYGADNDVIDSLVEKLKSGGHPVTILNIKDRYELSGEFFRWQFATAVAGHIIGIFPFDQPDVNAAKDKARAILDSGQTASGESDVPLQAALESLLAEPKPGDYVAIGAFMPESEELTETFQNLRAAITRSTGMPTTFGFGPRYLHSIGQLYKGGPGTVRFLGLISHGSGDLPVPGESYTLGSLTPAQAYGDFEAMRDLRRRIQTVGLGRNPQAEITDAIAHLG